EAAALDHRLEEPGERGVFVADVFLDVGPRPAAVRRIVERGTPGRQALFHALRLTAVDDIRKAQYRSGTADGAHPPQRQYLPEVRQVMQGKARVDEVGGRTGVIVGQEPGRHDFHVRGFGGGEPDL